MISRFALPALLALAACDSTPAAKSKPEPSATAIADEQTEPDAAPAAAGCVDWSKQDLSKLPALPESRYRRTLEQAWTLVVEKHYDPTLGCVDWPAARMRYGERLAKTRDQTEAFAVINQMLEELGQSHVKLFSPGSDEVVGPAKVDLTLRWIGLDLVAVQAGEETEVPVGAAISSIGDVSVRDFENRARARTKRPAEFRAMVARLATAALSCPAPGEKRRLQTRTSSAPQALPCVATEGETVSLGNLTDVPVRVEHRLIEGTKVGVIAFNVWMLPMVAKIEAALADLRAKGMKGLVLDLRGNPGGVGPMAVSVARSLLSEPGSLGKLEMRAFTQEFNVTPGPDPFSGPVALLVDEGTASTSEIFAAGLRDLGRVTIYGSGPSAGAALPSLIEQLDGGALFQYVVGDYHSPKGVLVEGKGVEPDHVVPETQADFRAGRDPVLEAAVAALKG
ncbi:MAG: S41 family peptidase [Myxococcota bacterium]